MTTDANNTEQGVRNPYDSFADGTRHTVIEPLFWKNEDGSIRMHKDEYDREWPMLRGMGFHMHSTAVVYTEDGIEQKGDCDYVVLDFVELAQLKNMLNAIQFNEIED